MNAKIKLLREDTLVIVTAYKKQDKKSKTKSFKTYSNSKKKFFYCHKYAKSFLKKKLNFDTKKFNLCNKLL